MLVATQRVVLPRIARLVAVALVTAAAACGGGASTPAAPAIGALTLGEPAAYVGTTDACVANLTNCLRAPATDGYFAAISQPGNDATFQIGSADPAVATGTLVMRGPGGVGQPAIALDPHRAGSTVLTVTGAGGATASVPITVTTVSALTVVVTGFPTAAMLHFTVSTPSSASCPGFQGGYTSTGTSTGRC